METPAFDGVIPALTIPRDDAALLLNNLIKSGGAVQTRLRRLSREEGLYWKNYWPPINAWEQTLTETLARLFTTTEVGDRYWSSLYAWKPNDDPSRVLEKLHDRLTHLRALRDRLHLYEEPVGSRRQLGSANAKPSSVFLVHGHDHALKTVVTDMLAGLGLDVTVLHEQLDRGRTVIEKFEDHANVAYAVVLLTPDDVGRSKAKPSALRPRARQNVVLELGYFLGALGRQRVLALMVGEVEVPSDLSGILFLEADAGETWRGRLIAELQAAGLPVD